MAHTPVAQASAAQPRCTLGCLFKTSHRRKQLPFAACRYSSPFWPPAPCPARQCKSPLVLPQPTGVHKSLAQSSQLTPSMACQPCHRCRCRSRRVLATRRRSQGMVGTWLAPCLASSYRSSGCLQRNAGCENELKHGCRWACTRMRVHKARLM